MNDFSINPIQEVAFEDNANILMFPITHAGIEKIKDGKEFLEYVKFNDLPDDIEFLQIQGMNELAASFWSESEKQAYWVELPYSRVKNGNLVNIKINNKEYPVSRYRIMRLDEFHRWSMGDVYMNHETYNKEQVFGHNSRCKSKYKFNSIFNEYASDGFKGSDNPFVLFYILKRGDLE